METERSYSGWERFMFFVTPILFVVVLLVVLLVMFNPDFRTKALEIGNGIPLLNRVLPNAPSSEVIEDDNTSKMATATSQITELEAKLAEKESELAEAAGELTKQEQEVLKLQQELSKLKQEEEVKQQENDEYKVHIKSLANVYVKMTPSKAAPILESMGLEEMVLILNNMKPDDRVRIMEKMRPKNAADATMMMKDLVPSRDQEIAALQARLKWQKDSADASGTELDEAKITATFSAMKPASAAELLLKMAENNRSKVLRILNLVNSQARSDIIAEMSKVNAKTTAQLVSSIVSRP
ncbi:MgtE protein [Paenibacillaceae bacterium]|nr:MgtE protein [Paenibacillaceae bacterium]